MKLNAINAAAFAVALAGFSLPAVAANEHGGHDHHGSMPAPAASAEMVDGLVKKVDKKAGKVTLSHGPLNGMPAMTMAFRVKDAAWLDQMKEGGKIRFQANDVNGAMTVVKFESAK